MSELVRNKGQTPITAIEVSVHFGSAQSAPICGSSVGNEGIHPFSPQILDSGDGVML